jgi:hypothetical protein
MANSNGKIRTVFNVAERTEFGNAGGLKVKLLPVIGGSAVENKQVWGGGVVPNGSIELHITNPDIKFPLGEYYVDFIPVEKKEA